MPDDPIITTPETPVDPPATEEQADDIIEENEDQTECLRRIENQNSTLLQNQTEAKSTLENLRLEIRNQNERLNSLQESVQSIRSRSMETPAPELETPETPELNPEDADDRQDQRTEHPPTEARRKKHRVI